MASNNAGKAACVQHASIVYRELRDSDVTGMRFYVDRAIGVTAKVTDLFQHAFAQGYVEVEDIVEFD